MLYYSYSFPLIYYSHVFYYSLLFTLLSVTNIIFLFLVECNTTKSLQCTWCIYLIHIYMAECDKSCLKHIEVNTVCHHFFSLSFLVISLLVIPYLLFAFAFLHLNLIQFPVTIFSPFYYNLFSILVLLSLYFFRFSVFFNKQKTF